MATQNSNENNNKFSAAVVAAAIAPPVNPPGIGHYRQTLYIGLQDEDRPEDSPATIFKTSPPNHHLAGLLQQETDTVTRTYNFVGAVPASYRHLLVADDQTLGGTPVSWGASTSVTKTYSSADWKLLTAHE